MHPSQTRSIRGSVGSSYGSGATNVIKADLFNMNDPDDRARYSEIRTKAFFLRDNFKIVSEPQTFYSQKEDKLLVYMEWEQPPE